MITVILAQEPDQNTLLTMSKEVIHVFSFQTKEEASKLQSPSTCISMKSESDYSELRDVFFTPGIAYSRGRVTFIKQMPLFETQTIGNIHLQICAQKNNLEIWRNFFLGDADIVSVDAKTGKTLSSVHINQKIRKLLAAGERYALLLLPYVDNNYKNLTVVDLAEGKIIGGGVVPHTRCASKKYFHGQSPNICFIF